MKRSLTALIALLAWMAVVTQYYLMIQNRVESTGETIIRFFSFFTILTNSLVAVFFTLGLFSPKTGRRSVPDQAGTLTAVTIYITIVGLVYQVVLRQTWEPTGLQKITDELLHSVIPLLVIVFWSLYENKSVLKFSQIPSWLIYPLLYLVYVLIRGSISGFYPYPFINVAVIGWQKVIINSAGITILFLVISVVFVKLGKSRVFL